MAEDRFYIRCTAHIWDGSLKACHPDFFFIKITLSLWIKSLKIINIFGRFFCVFTLVFGCFLLFGCTVQKSSTALPMDELPFNVELQNGWYAIDGTAYQIQFDENGSGVIYFGKAKMAETFDELLTSGYEEIGFSHDEFSIICRKVMTQSFPVTTYCGIKIEGHEEIYPLKIVYNGIINDRYGEVLQIIESLNLD